MTINPTLGLIYPYIKLRREFGRQPLFLEDHGRVHATVRPQPKHRKTVLKKANICNGAQAIPGTSLTEMNTIRAEYNSVSVLHTEGGWPKDVNMTEPEVMARYRKKLEKDDGYQAAVPIMTDEMEEHIKYNNTINFYRDAYNCIPIVGDRDLVPSATVVNVYRNPAPRPRTVSRITFAPDHAGRMAVAQCPMEFDPSLREHTGEAYFWEVETPSRPEGLVRGPSHITDVRYHPKDLHSLIGSLFTGQVATWDARVSPNPQAISSYEVSHKDVCTSALWINSKTGTEFFSCGLDGQIIWWDERNLSEALDTVYCDPEKGNNRPEKAIGATVLEYEHTLPTKFLCGNEKGDVMVFMKKAKSPSDRMVHLYKAHRGPVRSLHRNPMFIKNFLSVGDYHLRIFAEDCKESSIMWTIPSDSLYTYANWLKTRSSGFFAGRMDGVLEFWDLLIQGAKNILTLQVCDEPLTTVCAADGGKHVAVGTKSGDVRFVKITDFMGEFEKNDKPLLAAVFDRESRREKYLEQRNREIRLKKRDQDKKEADKDKKEGDKDKKDATKKVEVEKPKKEDDKEMKKIEEEKAGIDLEEGEEEEEEADEEEEAEEEAQDEEEEADIEEEEEETEDKEPESAKPPTAKSAAETSVPDPAATKEPAATGTDAPKKRGSVPASDTAASSMNIRHEALNDPVVKAEREFFLSIAAEIQSKGVGAFPDKMKADKEAKKGENASPGDSNADLLITAADLAEFEDDGNDEENKPHDIDPKDPQDPTAVSKRSSKMDPQDPKAVSKRSSKADPQDPKAVSKRSSKMDPQDPKAVSKRSSKMDPQDPATVSKRSSKAESVRSVKPSMSKLETQNEELEDGEYEGDLEEEASEYEADEEETEEQGAEEAAEEEATEVDEAEEEEPEEEEAEEGGSDPAQSQTVVAEPEEEEDEEGDEEDGEEGEEEQ